MCECALYVGRSLPDRRVYTTDRGFWTNEGDSYYLETRESKQTAPAVILTFGRNKRDWIMAHFVSITVVQYICIYI
jgi:hypothetical protein